MQGTQRSASALILPAMLVVSQVTEHLHDWKDSRKSVPTESDQDKRISRALDKLHTAHRLISEAGNLIDGR
jgi:hypothetical protein